MLLRKVGGGTRSVSQKKHASGTSSIINLPICEKDSFASDTLMWVRRNIIVADLRNRLILNWTKKYDWDWNKECRRWGGAGPDAADGKRRRRLWNVLTKSRKKCSENRLFWNKCGGERKYANFESLLKHWKRNTCVFFTKRRVAEWPVLHFRMSLFTY